MLRVGKRNFVETLKQIFNLNIFNLFLRFFAVHKNPISAIFNEFFSAGKYPSFIILRNKMKIKLYSVYDFSTLNLVFCRQDYYKPKKINLVVDIGSNIGISCLYWLDNNPNCKIKSFEPSSRNYKRLLFNTKKFNKNISCNKIGVSNKNMFAKLYLSKSGVNDSIKKTFRPKYEKIRLIDINIILRKLLLKNSVIDILKIDTEGTERQILENIKKEYFKKIKVINIEGSNYKDIVPSYFSFSFKGSASRFINTKY
jgi:FkbM family methyltransferase